MTIKDILSLEGYDTEVRKARRKGSKSTQEFFTPFEIVEKMCNKIPEETWKDPNKTFLEPCFGNGQFLLYIIWKRLHSRISLIQTLKTLYGVELMEDNVKETKERIIDLLEKLRLKFDRNEVLEILNKNLVCSDFFKWDFENWCPLPEQATKTNKKKTN